MENDKIYYGVEVYGDFVLFEEKDDARHAAGQIRKNRVNAFADDCRTYIQEDDDFVEDRKAVNAYRLVSVE